MLWHAPPQKGGLAPANRDSVGQTYAAFQGIVGARLVETTKNGRYVVYRLADALVSDFFRRFRLLAEDRLAEIEQIRRRFFSEAEGVNPVNRKTLLERVQQKKAVVIDVRPPNEYQTAHIAGA